MWRSNAAAQAEKKNNLRRAGKHLPAAVFFMLNDFN